MVGIEIMLLKTTMPFARIVVHKTNLGFVRFAYIPRNSVFCLLTADRPLDCVVRKPFQSRFEAVLKLLRSTRYRARRTFKFVINLDDRPLLASLWQPYPVFGPCSAEGFVDIAAPDFVLGGWPEAGIFDYDATCADLAAAGARPAETSLLGWYGNARLHHARQRFVGLAGTMQSRIEAVDVGNWYARGDKLDQISRKASGAVVTMPEQVARFRYLIDLEGKGYSGRLKLLLHSGRPILVQDRPWRDWFFPRLEAWKHYVPLRADFSDLTEVLNRLDAAPEWAASIGRAGQRFARANLTVAAAVDYWRDLLARTDAH